MAAVPSVGVGGVYKPVAAMSVGVGGVWKPVATAWCGVSGAWKPFFGALTVGIAAGVNQSGIIGTHAFGTNSATVSGGLGPFTYQWHESDDALGVWTAAGTSSTQSISVSGVLGGGNSSVSNYYCVITDTATGNAATTNTATYQWTHN